MGRHIPFICEIFKCQLPAWPSEFLKLMFCLLLECFLSPAACCLCAGTVPSCDGLPFYLSSARPLGQCLPDTQDG